MPHGSGVRVVASKNLKPGGSIKIVERLDEVRSGPLSAQTSRHDHYRIVALTEDLAIVDGPDYPTALRMLMASWQVPDAPTPVRSLFVEPLGHHRLAAMSALEDAVRPMSDEERAVYEQMLGEEP